MFLPESIDICINVSPNGSSNCDNSFGSKFALKFEWNDTNIFLEFGCCASNFKQGKNCFWFTIIR